MDLQTVFTRRHFKHRHTNQSPAFMQKSILWLGSSCVFSLFLSQRSLAFTKSDKTHAHSHLSKVPIGTEAMRLNHSQALTVNMVFPNKACMLIRTNKLMCLIFTHPLRQCSSLFCASEQHWQNKVNRQAATETKSTLASYICLNYYHTTYYMQCKYSHCNFIHKKNSLRPT